MKKQVIAVVLAASTAAALAAGASPGSVIEGFVRAGTSDAKLAASVTAILQRPVIVLVPGILGSKLTSPTIGDIWGSGIPDMNKVKLPARLVDEKAESDIQATLLEDYFGDQYGEAFTAIKVAAAKVGIDAVACGYDWRRDLRSSAADLEACITRTFGTKRRTLIFVSHSMGGIVTSVWNTKHDAKLYSSQHLVGGIVLLGSPLQGSCEVLRMIREGYKQPSENSLNAGKRHEYVHVKWDNLRDGLTNTLTSWATDGVREALLTWPGAFGLTPRATYTDEKGRPCVKVYSPEKPGGPDLISYFQPQFWTTVTGKEVLNGATPPAHFNLVLAKAKEFRDSFELARPRAPLYAYFSMYWSTPEIARLGDGGHLNAQNTWNPNDGDGRVPMPAGGSRPDSSWLSEYKPVNSVHGGLPKDKVFQDEFLAGRLPKLVQGLTAYELISELGKRPAVVAAYAKAGGAVPVVDEFKGALDVVAENSAVPPKSPLGGEIGAAADGFRRDLCRMTRSCLTTYKVAKQKTHSATERVATFAGVLGNEGGPRWERAAATAQIGLANVHRGEMRSAGPVLATASTELGLSIDESEISQSGRQQLADLKLVVDRNLAIALRESGQCKAARDLLNSIGASKTKYSADLTVRCLDRDTAVYQPLSDF